ncbi:hypothetical protein MY11210_009657 [Beauveria gryllotalpidicola]
MTTVETACGRRAIYRTCFAIAAILIVRIARASVIIIFVIIAVIPAVAVVAAVATAVAIVILGGLAVAVDGNRAVLTILSMWLSPSRQPSRTARFMTVTLTR